MRGRLFEVRHERSREDLKHAVAAGFKKKQMEFAVPAVRFGRVAGIGFNAVDRVLKAPKERGRHAADGERNDVDLDQEPRFNEFADVEVRNVHLHLNLRGEVFGPERIDRHPALGRAVDNPHLREDGERLADLVARHMEALGKLRFRVDAAARLGLTEDVLVNVAKERVLVGGCVAEIFVLLH